MDARESVGLSIQSIVAKEFEQRAVIGIAAGLRQYVDLGALMPELGGINTDLNFELLNRVNRRKYDVGVEIRVGVIDAVERVVVEHDALPARGYGLVGAVAPLPGTSLARRGRERVHVGRERDQTQILAAVQRQFGNEFVLDHGSNGCSLGLQQIRGGGNLDGVADLSYLEHDVEAHDLLYLDFEWFAGGHLETRKFRSQPIRAGRDGRKAVGARFRGHHVADCVGVDIGEGQGCSGYHGTGG